MEAAMSVPTVGRLLRSWRDARRLSQMELSLEAEVSTRHLSFVETGRAQPSRELIVRLAEHLDVPLRERNELLLAAGYAPVYAVSDLDDERMSSVRDAVRGGGTLAEGGSSRGRAGAGGWRAGREPYRALVVDRHWELLDANASVA